ncbi:hypothetical protein Axi01nite_67060 [Actinoplanes xinjiangensis]|nr:hypothetical protein Axi01nite_67060 [Actinoplanes xinjiangensis]
MSTQIAIVGWALQYKLWSGALITAVWQLDSSVETVQVTEEAALAGVALIMGPATSAHKTVSVAVARRRTRDITIP